MMQAHAATFCEGDAPPTPLGHDWTTYTVTVELSESGARQLRDENGRNWMEDMEYTDRFDGYGVTEEERVADATAQASELGTVKSVVPYVKPAKSAKAPDNAAFMNECAQLVVAMETSPYTFAGEFVDLRAQVKRLTDEVQALKAHEEVTVSRLNGEYVNGKPIETLSADVLRLNYRSM
jgi:hypothetical protein